MGNAFSFLFSSFDQTSRDLVFTLILSVAVNTYTVAELVLNALLLISLAQFSLFNVFAFHLYFDPESFYVDIFVA